MSKYLPDHLWVFNTSHDPDVTTPFTTGLDINVEHPLQPLCPGQRLPELVWFHSVTAIVIIGIVMLSGIVASLYFMYSRIKQS